MTETNRNMEVSLDQIKSQGGKISIEDLNKLLEKHNYKQIRENKDSIDDKEKAHSALDEYIAKEYGIKSEKPDEKLSAEKLEKERDQQLKQHIAEYGEAYDVEYQTNQILDELLEALDDAIDKVSVYRTQSSVEKSWGIPIITSMQKVLKTRRFKKMLNNIEQMYMKLPEKLRYKRYVDFLNKDNIRKKYGKGDKAMLAGETMTIGGVGTALGTVGLISLGVGAPISYVLGGAAVGIIGKITSYIGNLKSYEADTNVDLALGKLNDFRNEIISLKQGNRPGTVQRGYVGAARANIEAAIHAGLN